VAPRVEAAEPIADDYAELLKGLGIQPRAWIYHGPRKNIRFTIEVEDSDGPGAKSEPTMGIDDGARIVFALLPSSGPNDQPKAHIAVSSEGSRSSATATLPRLWEHWSGSSSMSTSSQATLNLGEDPAAPESVLHEAKAELYPPPSPDSPNAGAALAPARTVVLRLRAVVVPPIIPALETTEAGHG
jgi:hypothetical protein